MQSSGYDTILCCYGCFVGHILPIIVYGLDRGIGAPIVYAQMPICAKRPSAFLSSSDFFQNQLFRKFPSGVPSEYQNTIRLSNSLDLDQTRLLVGPDLGPNCLL